MTHQNHNSPITHTQSPQCLLSMGTRSMGTLSPLAVYNSEKIGKAGYPLPYSRPC